jgi:hypothetical protein
LGGGGLIFDASGSRDRAWQIGVLVGATARAAQIAFGGAARPRINPKRYWQPVRSVWLASRARVQNKAALEI